MFIGRIISKNKNLDVFNLIEVTDDIRRFDDDIPTLIIGKNLAEEIYGKENVHVLDKHINKTTMWTFSKTEKRNEFEKDFLAFKRDILKKFKINITYKYLNIFMEPCGVIKKMLKFLYYGPKKTIYIVNDHAYISYKNVVYGFSFLDNEYIGIKTDKIVERLKRNKNNLFINDDFLTKESKSYINNEKYLIPCLYNIQN